MCPTTVWIIFTRILNVILASKYNCLVQLLTGFIQLFNTYFKYFFLNYYFVFALSGLGGENDVSRVKRGR